MTPRTTAHATVGDAASSVTPFVPNKPAKSRKNILTLVFLTVVCVIWMVPLIGALIASFRFYLGDTLENGVFSVPARPLTMFNYQEAWTRGQILSHFFSTMIIVFPALILTLLLASMLSFAASRFTWRFNVFCLVFFTVGNLMPHQIAFQPLVRIFKALPLPNILSDVDTGNFLGTKWSVILVHVAFQTGFCTFVLSNYMKTIPREITEAALIDGASIPTQYWRIIMPLTKPALAALAALQFNWLYNDYFWGTVLIQRGDNRPITSSIAVLSGQFTSDPNLNSAASIMIALPTVLVFIALQRFFVGGLTVGATKG